MEGVRQDVDLHVAANLIKIMAMAKVNRGSLHTDALDRTLERIYELLFSLIFQGGRLSASFFFRWKLAIANRGATNMKRKTKKEKQGHARLFELADARKNKLTLACALSVLSSAARIVPFFTIYGVVVGAAGPLHGSGGGRPGEEFCPLCHYLRRGAGLWRLRLRFLSNFPYGGL